MQVWMTLLVTTLTVLPKVTNGFAVPSFPTLPQRQFSRANEYSLCSSKPRRLILHYQQGTDGGNDHADEGSVIIAKAIEESASSIHSEQQTQKLPNSSKNNEDDDVESTKTLSEKNDHFPKNNEKSLVLPRTTASLHTNLIDPTDQRDVKELVSSSHTTITTNNNKLQNFWKRLRKWGKRPGVKFRLRLGFVTTIALAASSLWAPQKRLWTVGQWWIAHRGFQGIAALGRSVAYLWAVLVAYPRMLDKRASERRRSRKEKELDRRRNQLTMLANEVSRLRQELASIDAEIRSFRREVIAMKAYAKSNSISDSISQDTDVQEAIENEMAHMRQLRSDTHAQLTAARESYSSVRSQSPPEVWEDNLILP